MSASSVQKEFVSYVTDLMQSVGPVYAKGMFGGHGVFLDDLMFALIADNILYLKVDKNSEDDFKDKGLEAFTYIKQGKEISMSYFQAPEDALEDSEVMNLWASKAYDAALRSAGKFTE
jgi:DNA transformation protein